MTTTSSTTFNYTMTVHLTERSVQMVFQEATAEIYFHGKKPRAFSERQTMTSLLVRCYRHILDLQEGASPLPEVHLYDDLSSHLYFDLSLFLIAKSQGHPGWIQSHSRRNSYSLSPIRSRASSAHHAARVRTFFHLEMVG